MKSNNGTVLAEPVLEQPGRFTLSAALSAALLSGTGHARVLPPVFNGTTTIAIGAVRGSAKDSVAREALPAATTASGTIEALRSHSDESIAPSSVSGMLTEIRSNFQLSASELAQVLRISRPTLYSWTSEKSAPRTTHVSRIQTLRAAGGIWRQLIRDRSETVAQRYADKPQLLDALSAEALDPTWMMGRLVALAAARRAAPQTRSIADRLRERGFEAQSPSQQARALENEGW